MLNAITILHVVITVDCKDLINTKKNINTSISEKYNNKIPKYIRY